MARRRGDVYLELWNLLVDLMAREEDCMAFFDRA